MSCTISQTQHHSTLFLSDQRLFPLPQGAPRTFWIHKRADGTVIFHYKEYSQDEVWAPFVDPLADVKKTLAEGIELFSTIPSDPIDDPPPFVPLRSA